MKYDIKWHSKDNKTGHPVILHNSPSGAVERIVWGLLETSARYEKEKVTGIKTWLSPIQCRIMTISEKESDYAEEILTQLNKKNIRCDYDDRDEKIGKKIRTAETEWIPYTIIVGNKEVENKTVSVRKRLIGQPLVDGKTNDQINDIPLKKLISLIEKDLKGLPRRALPIPFQRLSTRISLR